MEEKLIEILSAYRNQKQYANDAYSPVYLDKEKTAAEIADIYDLFIEWLCSNAQFDLLAERQYLICTETYVLEYMTLNEVFNYWWDNIKEK